MNKLNHTKHPIELMWVCMAFAVLAIVLIIGGVGAGGNSPRNRGAK